MTRAPVAARVSWRAIRHPGKESATLLAQDDGWRLEGHAEIRFPEGPTQIRYEIGCTRGWEPRAAQIEVRLPSERHQLHLQVDDQREWTIDGFRSKELRGCIDLDFAASPSTNTLALNRLGLPIGGSQEILTAWVLFPDLEIRAVRQRYTRTSDRHYQYEGLHNGFAAEFDLDEEGFVVDYPGSWVQTSPRREARRPRSAPGTRRRKG